MYTRPLTLDPAQALAAARAVAGFGLAAAGPVAFTLLLEWLPPRARGTWLVAFNLWWAFLIVLWTSACSQSLLLSLLAWQRCLAGGVQPAVRMLIAMVCNLQMVRGASLDTHDC